MNTAEFKNQLLDMKTTISKRVDAINRDKTRVDGPLNPDVREQS